MNVPRGSPYHPRSALANTPRRKWNREYLPGYTGHVPTKNDFCGKTSGSINREICVAGGQQSDLDRLEMDRHMANKVELPTSKFINRDVFGNKSRHAKNWISGPTHMIRRQHIPGYTGHVQGKVNRDIMGKSHARITAELFAMQAECGDGDNSDPRTRHFLST